MNKTAKSSGSLILTGLVILALLFTPVFGLLTKLIKNPLYLLIGVIIIVILITSGDK